MTAIHILLVWNCLRVTPLWLLLDKWTVRLSCYSQEILCSKRSHPMEAFSTPRHSPKKMAFSTPYPTSHPQVFASSFWCRSCNCVLVKIIPSAIGDRLVSCSLYFCHGHVGPESTRPTCQYRALACWGLVALAFASRPDGHEFLSHHHLHAYMLTWQSFLVDLGTVRTFSCSMMHVANNGKNEFLSHPVLRTKPNA